MTAPPNPVPPPPSDDLPSCRPACPDTAGTITCRECAEFLLDYIDGLLPPDQRSHFDTHMALCRDCAVYLDNYRKAAALTAGLARDDRLRTGHPVPERLVEAILKARKGQSPPHAR